MKEKKMETKNFVIRETEFGDYEYFARWETDPDVVRYLSFDEDRTYEDVVREGFSFAQDPSRLEFTIVSRSEEKPIGRISLSRIDKHSDSLDITKFYIGEKRLWGKGVAREIMVELLEYCFTFFHMERVTLDFYTGNRRGSSLYESLGFKHEGTARHATKKDGRYYDLNIMSMLRSEFFGENK